MRLNFVAILTTTDIIMVVLVGELLVVVNLFEYWLLPTTADHCGPIPAAGVLIEEIRYTYILWIYQIKSKLGKITSATASTLDIIDTRYSFSTYTVYSTQLSSVSAISSYKGFFSTTSFIFQLQLYHIFLQSMLNLEIYIPDEIFNFLLCLIKIQSFLVVPIHLVNFLHKACS